MSYKTIFSGSAGPFSGILRPRVAGLMTLRFFAKRLFSRDLWLGLYSDGFRVAWLVARPFFCRLPCRVACGPAFILSASVSRDLWSGLFFCRLPCRVACGPAFILSAFVSRGSWSGLYVIGLLSSPVPPPSLPPPSSRSLSPEPPYGSTIPFLPG